MSGIGTVTPVENRVPVVEGHQPSERDGRGSPRRPRKEPPEELVEAEKHAVDLEA